MTKTVTFLTPGTLDEGSFMTFGVNAKPETDNPIGYFGTGLKYAIAVLVRTNDHSIRITTKDKEYIFYCKRWEFRDSAMNRVCVKYRKAGSDDKFRYKQLPFTTDLGKNWELWMAFRELESNTRDEEGQTIGYNSASLWSNPCTHIEVTGDAFYECYRKRDEIFLSSNIYALNPSTAQSVQIIRERSKYIYYRGLRVFELEKPSMYTYNIVDKVELTEDRTLKYEFMAQNAVTRAIMTHDDPALIASVLGAKDADWEYGLSYDDTYVVASDTFQQVLSKRVTRQGSCTPRAGTYFSRYLKPREPDPLESVPEDLQAWLDGGVLDDYPELAEFNAFLKEKVVPYVLNDGIPF